VRCVKHLTCALRVCHLRSKAYRADRRTSGTFKSAGGAHVPYAMAPMPAYFPSHVLQMEVNMTMLNIANSLQSRQDALDANMKALKQQLDSLLQGQQGQWI